MWPVFKFNDTALIPPVPNTQDQYQVVGPSPSLAPSKFLACRRPSGASAQRSAGGIGGGALAIAFAVLAFAPGFSALEAHAVDPKDTFGAASPGGPAVELVALDLPPSLLLSFCAFATEGVDDDVTTVGALANSYACPEDAARVIRCALAWAASVVLMSCGMRR